MNGRLREGPKRLSPLPLVHPVTFVPSRAPSAPANRREGRAKSCCSVKPTLGARSCVPRSPRRSPPRRSGSVSTRATDSVLQRRRTDTFVPGDPSCRDGELEPPSVGGGRFVRCLRTEVRFHPSPHRPDTLRRRLATSWKWVSPRVHAPTEAILILPAGSHYPAGCLPPPRASDRSPPHAFLSEESPERLYNLDAGDP
jgi:hypothetical protein